MAMLYSDYSVNSVERAFCRRELIRAGVLAGVAAVATPRWLIGQELFPSTPSTILGPYYPLRKPADRDADMTRIKGKRGRAQGQVIEIAGRILNQKGAPVRHARVELWQANAMGRYTHPSDPNPAPLDPFFTGYGVQLTDGEGRFRFTTIKPGPYPFDKSRIRSPHVHFEVTGHTDRRVTQMFFADEPLNERDVVLQATFRNRDALIAELQPPPPDADPRNRLVRWDIVIPTDSAAQAHRGPPTRRFRRPGRSWTEEFCTISGSLRAELCGSTVARSRGERHPPKFAKQSRS